MGQMISNSSTLDTMDLSPLICYWQTPPMHLRIWTGQLLPQAPQFSGSFCRFFSQPSMVAELQSP